MVLRKICHILHNKDLLLGTDLCLTVGRWDLQKIGALVHTNITRHIYQIPVTLHVCLTWLRRNLGKVASCLIFRMSYPAELCCRWKLTVHHQQNHQSHESRDFGNIEVSWDILTGKKGGRFTIHINLCEFIQWVETTSKKTTDWRFFLFSLHICVPKHQLWFQLPLS